jgi:hypothetical protein
LTTLVPVELDALLVVWGLAGSEPCELVPVLLTVVACGFDAGMLMEAVRLVCDVDEPTVAAALPGCSAAPGTA